eukprot:4914982-Pleurochrysis_carterae.AAC.2
MRRWEREPAALTLSAASAVRGGYTPRSCRGCAPRSPDGRRVGWTRCNPNVEAGGSPPALAVVARQVPP